MKTIGLSPLTWAVLPVVLLVLAVAVGPLLAEDKTESSNDGWVSLFNGKDLTGWEINENPDTFQVVDGVLVIKGPRGHAFYAGDVCDHDFKNFEWKCEIMTKPNSNSGMYFHTKFQETGWPNTGYEAQVNCSHVDRKKSGGLYAVADVMDKAPHGDNEWFTQHVIVKDKRIVIKVNGEVTTDYTEPDDVQRPEGLEGRVLSSGTIAIQGHDPDSEIHYRKIMIKPLDD